MLAKVTYPNGREVSYDYGTAGAIDEVMSRVGSIFEDTDDGQIDSGEEVFLPMFLVEIRGEEETGFILQHWVHAHHELAPQVRGPSVLHSQEGHPRQT